MKGETSFNYNKKNLTMPRVLTLYQKCTEYNIQGCLIERLHYNDLLLLIYSFDIENLKKQIATAKKMRQISKGKKNAPEIRDVSQADALKYLK